MNPVLLVTSFFALFFIHHVINVILDWRHVHAETVHIVWLDGLQCASPVSYVSYRNRIAIESQAVSCVRAADPCSGGYCDYRNEYGGPMTGGEIRDELLAYGELCFIG